MCLTQMCQRERAITEFFEGVCLELTSSWPPARVEGRSRAVVGDTWSGESGESGDEFRTYDSAADVYRKIGFGPPGGSIFKDFQERGIIFTVYNIQTAESKSSDSLAQGENTSSENSPGHGNAKNHKIRARGSFWVTRFIYLRLMWQVICSRAVFWENKRKCAHVWKDIGGGMGSWWEMGGPYSGEWKLCPISCILMYQIISKPRLLKEIA